MNDMELRQNILDQLAFEPSSLKSKRIGIAVEWGEYNNRFKVGGVKITIDGSPQGCTAFFTTPYLTGGPAGEKDWKGELTFPQDTVNQMVKKRSTTLVSRLTSMPMAMPQSTPSSRPMNLMPLAT